MLARDIARFWSHGRGTEGSTYIFCRPGGIVGILSSGSAGNCRIRTGTADIVLMQIAISRSRSDLRYCTFLFFVIVLSIFYTYFIGKVE